MEMEMGLVRASDKPHAVCIPYPSQGHVNPSLQVANCFTTEVFSSLLSTLSTTTSVCSDENCLTNGYLDTIVDSIPGMTKAIRLRDFPAFFRTTDPNDIMLNFVMEEEERANKASAIILNTFDALEKDVLDALTATLPSVYPIGSLQHLVHQISDDRLKIFGSSLWKEQPECLQWLDPKEPNSVVYMNFGSLIVMTPQHLTELAWGLANSNKPFLWIIRPDLVAGDSAPLPPEFITETIDRGMLASWCPQEQILKHPAVGWFVTHCGWNSTSENICGGVPLICMPFRSEQLTNCRYSCSEWGIGMEIDGNVKRDKVEKLVRELMDGEKGKKMKKKARHGMEEVGRRSHYTWWVFLQQLQQTVQ